jgi:carboxypeptidase Taq
MPLPADKNKLLAELKERLATWMDLNGARGLLEWDQQTYMPVGAAAARGQQAATLSALAHELLTDGRVSDLLSALEDSELAGEADRALLRVTRRHHDQAAKLPEEFVREWASLTSEAQQVWVQAREDDEFSAFEPVLARIIDLSRQQAEYLGYQDHPYDALLDLYEPGATTAQIRELFAPLRDETVDLVERIAQAPDQLSDEVVRRDYPELLQEQFGREVASQFGFDFITGRLDQAVHPFAISLDSSDVRITTRYQRNHLNAAVFGIFHEAGHGMYEQGIAPELDRSPLAGGVSLGVHESQSRLWENLVGRSLGFWQGAYPRLQELFREPLAGVTVDSFYEAINTVSPSLIRVEADEVTYNLHIMIRFELELALLEGSLAVSDLPAAWNEKYHDYLGITPPNDTLGCLQDVHWAAGLIGYFPTYALGNLMSVQLFEAAGRAHPELQAEIRSGDFVNLLGWLRKNVHEHGSVHEPQDLLLKATGSKLDAGPYVNYLRTKFGALYGLD